MAMKLPVGSGNTGKSKAVKKAGGPVSINDASTGSGNDGIKISDHERKYRAQSDARTLAEAEEIRRDKARMKDVKGHVKLMNKACE